MLGSNDHHAGEGKERRGKERRGRERKGTEGNGTAPRTLVRRTLGAVDLDIEVAEVVLMRDGAYTGNTGKGK